MDCAVTDNRCTARVLGRNGLACNHDGLHHKTSPHAAGRRRSRRIAQVQHPHQQVVCGVGPLQPLSLFGINAEARWATEAHLVLQRESSGGRKQMATRKLRELVALA